MDYVWRTYRVFVAGYFFFFCFLLFYRNIIFYNINISCEFIVTIMLYVVFVAVALAAQYSFLYKTVINNTLKRINKWKWKAIICSRMLPTEIRKQQYNKVFRSLCIYVELYSLDMISSLFFIWFSTIQQYYCNKWKKKQIKLIFGSVLNDKQMLMCVMCMQ